MGSHVQALTLIKDADLKPISPTGVVSSVTAEHVHGGLPIPKVTRVKIFSPEEFEAFVEEWASSLTPVPYAKVRRFAGSGDMGIDVAGFTSDQGFAAPWDNHQCKRYDHPLRQSDIYKEIGKIIYYSWSGEFTAPRKHFFVASQGIGTSLEKLLADSEKLKQAVHKNWAQSCQTTAGITSTKEVPLEGQLLNYFSAFDFSIFSSKSVLELVEQHSKTAFHSVRFGGGFACLFQARRGGRCRVAGNGPQGAVLYVSENSSRTRRAGHNNRKPASASIS